MSALASILALGAANKELGMKSFRLVYIASFVVAAFLALGCDDAKGPCENDTIRCKNETVLEQCVEGGWKVKTECVDGYICRVEEEGCIDASTLCTETKKTCSEGQLTVCIAGESAVVEDCPLRCNDAKDDCSPAVCEEDQARCNVDFTAVEHCVDGAWKSTKCGDEQICKPDSHKCELVKLTCDEDKTTCDDGKLTKCVKDEMPETSACPIGLCEDVNKCKVPVCGAEESSSCINAYAVSCAGGGEVTKPTITPCTIPACNKELTACVNDDCIGTFCSEGRLVNCGDADDENRTITVEPCVEGCKEDGSGCIVCTDTDLENPICKDGKLRTCAVVDVEANFRDCEEGCNSAGNACKEDERCKDNATTCGKDGNLSICTLGEYPEAKPCPQGCDMEQNACKLCEEASVECSDGVLTECVIGQIQESRKCVDGCRPVSDEEPDAVAGCQVCSEDASTCSTTDDGKGTLKTCVEGKEAVLSECPSGCNEEKNACKQICKKDRIAAELQVNDSCHYGDAGRCSEDKSKWLYCASNSKVAVINCNKDCETEIDEAGTDGGCSYKTCTKTYTEEKIGHCDNTPNQCDDNKKGGQHCTGNNLYKITCIEGFKCHKMGDYIACELDS